MREETWHQETPALAPAPGFSSLDARVSPGVYLPGLHPLLDQGRYVMVPLYFAFPDGVLHYVCAECTALCCRGQGFAGSLGREMAHLVKLYPNLESAIVERRGDVLTVATPAGRCHFLDGDNLCRIEKEHGRSLKPGVCVLFPFNSFSLVGKTLVVAPHFLCPVRLQVPPRPGEVEGTHARLEAAVRESGMAGDAYLKVAVKPARLHPSEPARSVLAREIAFRDRCGAAIGVGTFRDTVLDAAADAGRLEERIARGAALLGLDVPEGRAGRDGTDDILLAVAPSLRLGFLRLSAEGILLAMALAELVVRRLTPLASAPPTPQGVFDTVQTALPALHLLGCAGGPVSASQRGRPKAPPFGDPAMVFAGYRVLRAVSGEADILDVLEAGMARLASVADRSAFLAEMGTLIGPSFRPRRAARAAEPTGLPG